MIDAKRYKGRRPSREATGGVFGPRIQTLRIGGRDGTALVDGVRKQAALVAAALGDATPVAAALCFLEADWGFFGSPFSISEVLVTWPVRLVKRIAESADVGVDVDAVAARLAAAFRLREPRGLRAAVSARRGRGGRRTASALRP
ncbi:hypothetical protein [Microbacterium azadirachtae]|uniref:hypothetical protein n=1 Tax=Microbacterium azadirachtae TaxID=582680 RepID=UPI0030B8C7AD